MYVYIYIYIYIHVSDCAEIVCELPLLPDDTESEIFLHKLGVVQRVELIFISDWPHT